MFEIITTNIGYKLMDTETGKPFGETFQESCRSPEVKAAMIVFEKYKRKFNLQYEDLIKLSRYVINFSEERKQSGKKVSNDYLVQIASNEIKTYNK